MTEAVRLPLVRIMRAVARSYDIEQSNEAEAEAALNEALEEFTGDEAVNLGNYLVELAVPGAGATSSSEDFHDTRREQRLDRMRREEMRKILTGGRDEVIAQWLAKHGGDPSALLEMEAEAKAVEAEQVLRAVQLTTSGKEDEPFDHRDVRRRLLSRFLSDDPELPAAEGNKRGSRRSRIAGSLGPAIPSDLLSDDETPREGGTVTTDVSDARESRTSRVRGRASAGADAEGDRLRESSGLPDAAAPAEPSEVAPAKENRARTGGRVRGVRPADRPPAGRARPATHDPDALPKE